jgi:glycosyltransferase involved in cell wall biosynthesis
VAKIAILGTVGVPAIYGGFETLAENLVLNNSRLIYRHDLIVYCSSRSYSVHRAEFEGARLRYLPLDANGKQAMFYDMWSLIDASLRGCDTVLLLGHGGSFVIPILKFFTKTKFVTNIDGIEWRREKWTGIARWIIRQSEAMAVRCSHVVIADNEAIREYLAYEYKQECEVIPYGGDHALDATLNPQFVEGFPVGYALAVCRIEPENNVAMILEAFAKLDKPLVFVGNWDRNEYGRQLKARYRNHSSITIHDPVYEPRSLRSIRDGASLYVHGHSAGGTNPSLVEIMHFGIPVIAHGCSFNRHSTEGKALYFQTSDELVELMQNLVQEDAARIGAQMRNIAQRRYTWDQVSNAYFKLCDRA